MLRVGVADASSVSNAELDAYRVLTLGNDRGWGYLRIMAALRTADEYERYAAVLDSRNAPYPIAVAWGVKDPILPLSSRGAAMLAATHLPSLTELPGKHYLQEDQAPAIAELIVKTARRS